MPRGFPASCRPDAHHLSNRQRQKLLTWQAAAYLFGEFGRILSTQTHTHTHTHTFNDSLSGTTPVSRYQKSKTNLDFTRDSEWQWHQLGHMQVCTSLQTDNHASTSPLCFLQAGCPSCRPTNSVKALRGHSTKTETIRFDSLAPSH